MHLCSRCLHRANARIWLLCIRLSIRGVAHSNRPSLSSPTDAFRPPLANWPPPGNRRILLGRHTLAVSEHTLLSEVRGPDWLASASSQRPRRRSSGRPRPTSGNGDRLLPARDGFTFGFEGKHGIGTDTDAGGVVLMGARLYDSMTGRFLQVDPVFAGSCNAYDYLSADSINATDLSGETPFTVTRAGKHLLGGPKKSLTKQACLAIGVGAWAVICGLLGLPGAEDETLKEVEQIEQIVYLEDEHLQEAQTSGQRYQKEQGIKIDAIQMDVALRGCTGNGRRRIRRRNVPGV